MKKVICVLSTVIIIIGIVGIFNACGSKEIEPFVCDGCGKTITEGNKNTVTDYYGDEYNYCDDCYKELQELKLS